MKFLRQCLAVSIVGPLVVFSCFSLTLTRSCFFSTFKFQLSGMTDSKRQPRRADVGFDRVTCSHCGQTMTVQGAREHFFRFWAGGNKAQWTRTLNNMPLIPAQSPHDELDLVYNEETGCWDPADNLGRSLLGSDEGSTTYARPPDRVGGCLGLGGGRSGGSGGIGGGGGINTAPKIRTTRLLRHRSNSDQIDDEESYVNIDIDDSEQLLASGISVFGKNTRALVFFFLYF